MENIHSGHRSRMREKYIQKGADSFEKHELIELLLFHALPRGNTNPIGHELINRFGSVCDVLGADKAELKKTDGVGDSAAQFLGFIGDIVSEYSVRSSDGSERQLRRNGGMRFARKLFSDNPSESRLYIVMLGARDSVLSVDLLAKGDYSYSDVSIRSLVLRAIRIHAQRAVLVHNHVSGSLLPSDADIRFTREVERAFSYIDIELNDHILVAGSTAVSIRHDMFKKKSDNGLTSEKK